MTGVAKVGEFVSRGFLMVITLAAWAGYNTNRHTHTHTPAHKQTQTHGRAPTLAHTCTQTFPTQIPNARLCNPHNTGMIGLV